MTIDLRRLVDVLEPSGRSTLESAVALAMTNGHATIGIGHWLKRLVDADGPLARETAQHVDLGRIDSELNGSLAREPRGSGAPGLSPLLVTLIREAFLVASLQHGRQLSRRFLEWTQSGVVASTLRIGLDNTGRFVVHEAGRPALGGVSEPILPSASACEAGALSQPLPLTILCDTCRERSTSLGA